METKMIDKLFFGAFLGGVVFLTTHSLPDQFSEPLLLGAALVILIVKLASKGIK